MITATAAVIFTAGLGVYFATVAIFKIAGAIFDRIPL